MERPSEVAVRVPLGLKMERPSSPSSDRIGDRCTAPPAAVLLTVGNHLSVSRCKLIVCHTVDASCLAARDGVQLMCLLTFVQADPPSIAQRPHFPSLVCWHDEMVCKLPP